MGGGHLGAQRRGRGLLFDADDGGVGDRGPVHDRMPVLLTPEFFERYLAAETASDLQFPPQPLAVEAVENPLKRSPSLEDGQPQASTAVQGELF